MKIMKKVLLLTALTTITIFGTGCMSNRTVIDVIFPPITHAVFSSTKTILDFMKDNGYVAEDIGNMSIESSTEDREHLFSFTLKEKVECTSELKKGSDGEYRTYLNITGDKDSIEDIVNCMSFMLDYEDREKNYTIYEDCILQALNNKNRKGISA